MLLTLAAQSLHELLDADGEGSLSLLEVPKFAAQQLNLRGMNVPASMLAGWVLEDMDRLRDQADKVGCPCLVLVEEMPLSFADPKLEVREQAADRVRKLALAANRLGCNAVAIRCKADDNTEDFDLTASQIKSLMPSIERYELNVLLAPCEGLTASPDRLTELIKRIGGFRIGSLPNFADAAATGNVVEALRKLAPYAGAIHATVEGFTKAGKHKGYDLAECVEAIRSVGFVNTLAIDFRGAKDSVANIEQAREILQTAIENEK